MDHKAAGYHLARSQGAVCGKVGAWRAGREAEQLPDSPPWLDFYLRDNFGMAKVEWLVLYCTVLYCTVLYCTVLHTRWSGWRAPGWAAPWGTHRYWSGS